VCTLLPLKVLPLGVGRPRRSRDPKGGIPFARLGMQGVFTAHSTCSPLPANCKQWVSKLLNHLKRAVLKHLASKIFKVFQWMRRTWLSRSASSRGCHVGRFKNFTHFLTFHPRTRVSSGAWAQPGMGAQPV